MKPSTTEERCILEHEMNLRLQKLKTEQQAVSQAEKNRLKELHWMHCPKCGQELATEYNGEVEVDFCPTCQGVWLDANELEAIVASQSGFLQSFLRILR